MVFSLLCLLSFSLPRLFLILGSTGKQIVLVSGVHLFLSPSKLVIVVFIIPNVGGELHSGMCCVTRLGTVVVGACEWYSGMVIAGHAA